MHLVGFIIRIYHDARSPGRNNLVKFHVGFVTTNRATLMSNSFAEVNNILLHYDILAVIISEHNILPNPYSNPRTFTTYLYTIVHNVTL